MAYAESPSKLTGRIGVKVAVGGGDVGAGGTGVGGTGVGGTVVGRTGVGGTGVCAAFVGVAESESIWVGETIAVTLCTALVFVGDSTSEQADKPIRIMSKTAAGILTTYFCPDFRLLVSIILFKNKAVRDALFLC